MSRRLAIARTHRPSVGFEYHRSGSHVDHGFDTDDHALAEQGSSAAGAVVRNTGVFVHLPTQTVSLQLAHHAVAEFFGILLHGRRDIAYAISRPGLCRTFIKSLFGDFHELFHLVGNGSYGKRVGRITNKPLHKCTAIHRNDVALFENLRRRRNTVDHLLVDRNAQRCRIALIPQKSRNCSVGTDKLLADAIQLLGRDAGPYVAPHFGQRPAHEKVVLAEQFDLFFVL